MGGLQMRPEIQRMMIHHYGFVLTELLIVILIIGILAGVAVPLYVTYLEKAKLSEATSTIGAIITSQKL